jgi:hypothetical protein
MYWGPREVEGTSFIWMSLHTYQKNKDEKYFYTEPSTGETHPLIVRWDVHLNDGIGVMEIEGHYRGLVDLKEGVE